MRKFYFILTALFCAALFTSCTDDDKDDEGGNGQGGENGGSGVVILPKKVTKIVLTESGSEEETWHCTYDDKDRVSTITTTYRGNPSGIVKKITYTDSKITITEENNVPMEIKLENGRAVSSSEYEGVNYNTQGTYSYSDNYLSKFIKKVVNVDVNDNSWKEYLTDSSTFVVTNGNLESVDYYYYFDEDEKEKGVMTFELNNDRDNNLSLDLYGLVIGEDVILLGLTGNRYKKMPSKVTYNEEIENKTYVVNYSYKVDEEGYITEMTEDTGDDQVFVYTITYE